MEKLKIVPNEQFQTNVGEIKEITKHRSRFNKNEYLVSWKNGDTDSWVKEEDFQAVDCINDYGKL